MKKPEVFHLVTVIYGMLVTLMILLFFGPKIYGEFESSGFAYLSDVMDSFAKWYDDPTPFFFMYVAGYALVWWKPWLGSLIIALGGILFWIFNPSNHMFLLVFILPTLVAALLYFADWMKGRRF